MTASGPLDRFKFFALLLLVAGHLVLGYAFMLIRVPPGGFGVPLGEILLTVVLLTTNVVLVVSRMGTVMAFPALLLWWTWGLTRLSVDAFSGGVWAFRDATQLIESLFLIVGFTLISDPTRIARLSRWLTAIIVIAGVYGLLYMYAEPIKAISPLLTGCCAQPIPIIGTFATTADMMLLGAFVCLTQPVRSPSSRLQYGLLAAFLVSYVVIVIQARTTYVQLVCLSALLFFVRPRALGRLGLTIPILVVSILIISTFEIRFAGRLSSQISWTFLWEHVQAIIGGGAQSDYVGLAEAAGGASMRFHWWLRLYQELTSDLATLITGLGYGVPLTDFRDTLGVVAREPHNSVVSVVARLGVIGGVAWFWLQFELLRVGIRTYRQCLHAGRRREARLVMIILLYAVIILSSCFGEDTMEKPYNAIPYYVLWGVVLRVAYNLQRRPQKSVFRQEVPTPVRSAS